MQAVDLRAVLALTLIAVVTASCRSPSPSHDEGRWFGAVKPPTDNVLRYNNGAEPESIDPALATGVPDGRIARMLFEGLTTPHPKTLEPLPAQAESWTVSEDGRTYTFTLREGLLWSDGTPLTAHDFVWSWLRVLRPSTGSRYASVLHVIEGARPFNDGETDESTVGISAPDDRTLVVRLEQPTSYFLHLTQFYTYLPTPRHAVEAHGDKWTRPGNVVANGPFLLESWRQGDRFVLVRNPRFRDAGGVKLDRIIAYSVEDLNTSTNLYKAGAIDWNPSGNIPSQFVPYVADFEDFRSGPYQGTYFFNINVTRPPLDDIRVRQALSLAVNRESLGRDLLKGSRQGWGLLTPTGYPGYEPPEPVEYDPNRARKLLAEAGYPGGKGFRRISILINTSEDHRRIAEAIQDMWKRELGIDVEITNQEWGSYLQSVAAQQYDIARRGWIGDYLDPNTFLSCFLTGDGNNRTGWGDPEFDRLLAEAAMELDPDKRFALLAQAEALLLEASPIIPLLLYSTTELIKPYVRGIYQNPTDTHPLTHVWIDRDTASWGRETMGGEEHNSVAPDSTTRNAVAGEVEDVAPIDSREADGPLIGRGPEDGPPPPLAPTDGTMAGAEAKDGDPSTDTTAEAAR